MGTVVLALERGFCDHHVVVTVDDVPVLDATNVTTDSQAGIAGSIAVECAPHCRIRVALPELHVTAELALVADELTFLRTFLNDGDRLVLRRSVEGPRYV